MKRILFLVLTAVSAFCYAGDYSSFGVSATNISCQGICMYGKPVQAKKLTVIDSSDAGNFSLKIGRTANLTEYYTVYWTNIVCNGTEITWRLYFVLHDDGIDLNLPLRSPANFAADHYNYYVHETDTGNYVDITDYSGTTHRCREYNLSNILSKYWYDTEVFTSLVSKVTWTGKRYKETGLGGFETNIYSSVVGTYDYSWVTKTNYPILEPRTNTTGIVFTDTFLYPKQFSRVDHRLTTVEREYPLVTTNYTGGVYEYTFPNGTFLLPDYTLKCTSENLSSNKCNISIIYER